MVNTLPASDPGLLAAAALPALPVATRSSVGDTKLIEPMLPVAPLGMPVRIGFTESPDAIRTTRLSEPVLISA